MRFPMMIANVTLAACLLVPTVSWAGWCPLDRNACGIRGLPGSVVEGIIQVESGGNPWALHMGIGKGYSLYPGSENEARRFLAVSLALTDNVDIGLMQVGWRTWRKHALGLGLTPYDLLDPQVNLEMGCHILARALSTRGLLRGAAGPLPLLAPRARAVVREKGAGRRAEARIGEPEVMPGRV